MSPDRITFEGELSESEVRSLAENPIVKTLQTSSAPSRVTCRRLNELLFATRPDVSFRLFGWGFSDCDLSILSDMPNVRRFGADCLTDIAGLEHLQDLERLEALSIGVAYLKRFEFLEQIAAGPLKQLSLGATQSKKPSLEHIGRFTNLAKLWIDGHHKGLKSVSGLQRLEELNLRCITVPSIGFLSTLPKLWLLNLSLGGTTNLAELDQLQGLKSLTIELVRKLENLEAIGGITTLQLLLVRDLRNVMKFPDLSRMVNLRRIFLSGMPGLTDLSVFLTAPALEEFSHNGFKGLEPAEFAPLLAKESVKNMTVEWRNQRKQCEFDDRREAAGVSTGYLHPFEFR